MKTTLAAALAALACTLTTASNALAFGGSAGQMEHQGNFVVTNNANFQLSQQVNTPPGTRAPSLFVLRPALDYFVIDHLSVGGAVEFDVFVNNDPRGPTITRFGLAPDVGYEMALSDTFSFWPQAQLAMFFPSQGNSLVTLTLSAPFLVHPVEHFFFGIGPFFAQDLTSNANTVIGIGFTIGGYFDH